LIISSPVIRDFIRKNNSTVVGPPVLVYVGGPPSLSSLVVRASLNVNEWCVLLSLACDVFVCSVVITTFHVAASAAGSTRGWSRDTTMRRDWSRWVTQWVFWTAVLRPVHILKPN